MSQHPMNSLSIVTVVRNRTAHLILSAQHVAQSALHAEHLILDFGSDPVVMDEDLPDDPRVRLIRCDWRGGWWLTHAYNLAFSLAQGDWILKLDADALIPDDFLGKIIEAQQSNGADFLCDRLTVQDWKLPSSMFRTNGLFLVSREALHAVRGFNPYIQGWGWDELDLYSRLFLAGFSSQRLPIADVRSIDHSDDERQQSVSAAISATRLKKAMNQKNMLVAQQAYLTRLEWPDLDAYSVAFAKNRKPPVLVAQALLNSSEVRALAMRCSQTLLRPGHFQRLIWRLKACFGYGPYSEKSALSFLADYGIDLRLVVSSCFQE